MDTRAEKKRRVTASLIGTSTNLRLVLPFCGAQEIMALRSTSKRNHSRVSEAWGDYFRRCFSGRQPSMETMNFALRVQVKTDHMRNASAATADRKAKMAAARASRLAEDPWVETGSCTFRNPDGTYTRVENRRDDTTQEYAVAVRTTRMAKLDGKVLATAVVRTVCEPGSKFLQYVMPSHPPGPIAKAKEEAKEAAEEKAKQEAQKKEKPWLAAFSERVFFESAHKITTEGDNEFGFDFLSASSFGVFGTQGAILRFIGLRAVRTGEFAAESTDVYELDPNEHGPEALRLPLRMHARLKLVATIQMGREYDVASCVDSGFLKRLSSSLGMAGCSMKENFPRDLVLLLRDATRDYAKAEPYWYDEDCLPRDEGGLNFLAELTPTVLTHCGCSRSGQCLYSMCPNALMLRTNERKSEVSQRVCKGCRDVGNTMYEGLINGDDDY